MGKTSEGKQNSLKEKKEEGREESPIPKGVKENLGREDTRSLKLSEYELSKNKSDYFFAH